MTENHAEEHVTLDSTELEARVEDLFEQYTTSHFLLQKEMLELLEDLKIKCTMERLQGSFPEEKYDLDTAKEIAVNFHSIQNAGQATDALTSQNVVAVSPVEFISLLFRCKRRRRTEYRIVWPTCSFTIRPRFILLTGTGLALLLTGMFVILTIALFWIDTETEREKRISDAIGRTVGSFSELFERHWGTLAGVENSLGAWTMAKMQTKIVQNQGDHEAKRLLSAVEVLTHTILKGHDEQFLHNEGDYIRGLLKAYSQILRRMRTKPGVRNSVFTSLMAELNKKTQWDSVVLNTTTQELIVEPRRGCSSSHPCSVETSECLKNAKGDNVDGPFITWDLHGGGAYAISLAFPQWQAAACLFMNQTTLDASALQVALDAYVRQKEHFEDLDWDLNIVRLNYAEEIISSSSDNMSQSEQTKVVWETTNFHEPPSEECEATSCSTIDQFVLRALLSRKSQLSFDQVMPSGTLAVCAAVPTDHNFAIIACEDHLHVQQATLERIISMVDTVNTNNTKHLDVVVFSVDEETGVVSDQRTAFVNPEECLRECQRFPLARANAIAAAKNKLGHAITPDFRPLPVMGGYAYNEELGLIFVLEKDLLELREEASHAYIEILNDVNQELEGIEFVAVRPKDFPAMPVMSKEEPCPPGAVCLEDPFVGVIFREDCVDCLLQETTQFTELDLLTDLKNKDECAIDCSTAGVSKLSLYQDAAREEHSGTQIESTGYSGRQALASLFYIRNLSMGLVTQWPVDQYRTPILAKVTLSVGLSVLFVIVALLALTLQSKKYLDAIEHEWDSYKERIDDENKAFATTVMEVLPPRVTQKVITTSEQVSESIPLTAMFINIAAFRQQSYTWDVRYLTKYLSYSFHMITTVVDHYRLHKVKTIGDMVFIVGGLQDERDAASFSAMTERTVTAASIIMQLFGFRYNHNPNLIPWVKPLGPQDTMEDLGALRIGIHAGPCTTYVVRSSTGCPTYDVQGINVGVAHKLQAGAKPCHILISQQIRDSLERRCIMGQWKMGHKRTLVFKKVMIEMSSVSASQIDIPTSLLAALHIKHAHPRLYFGETDVGYDPPDPLNKPASQSLEGSVMSNRTS